MNVPDNNVVPLTVPGQAPQIESKYLAMAAAIMHQQAQQKAKPSGNKD